GQAAAGYLQSATASAITATGIRGSIYATWASFERRLQEWIFLESLAQQDTLIGNQQIELAQDRVRIVGQERTISQMETDFATDTAEFLATKFTNEELYDWMSEVLEGIYDYFLQEATAAARLAESQLAFERQEAVQGLIQADYWQPPSDDPLASMSGESGPDRRGLTGSARLLADLHRLDQYRFETAQRKQQLTRTLSLASLDPYAFQVFRETGVLGFRTALEIFDRDFPGHYLRLIRRIRVSVVALIPPTTGIRATLSTSGLSWVVVGKTGRFQRKILRRAPESVALGAPNDASGVFELAAPSSEMLLPFEGLGVDTWWELRLPKASNPFDYRTLFDVLFTLEYTALDSYEYRQQVIQDLDRRISADRAYSFRHQFADAWYDLHNPDPAATSRVVTFTTGREDFPPNLEDASLKIEHVVLYLAGSQEGLPEVPVVVQFQADGAECPLGGEAITVDGRISTRGSNAGGWSNLVGQPCAGTWSLTLPADKDLFAEGRIEDILLVITYRAETPPWPA
ncbi:MAG: hypothetical protein SX243_22510, partial [Acidobacteriota bacterium]|nr:hypothetical protein [Acidobacteriota bacterium]